MRVTPITIMVFSALPSFADDAMEAMECHFTSECIQRECTTTDYNGVFTYTESGAGLFEGELQDSSGTFAYGGEVDHAGYGILMHSIAFNSGPIHVKFDGGVVYNGPLPQNMPSNTSPLHFYYLGNCEKAG